jgi:hypothetical protein
MDVDVASMVLGAAQARREDGGGWRGQAERLGRGYEEIACRLSISCGLTSLPARRAAASFRHPSFRSRRRRRKQSLGRSSHKVWPDFVSQLLPGVIFQFVEALRHFVTSFRKAVISRPAL